MTASTTAQGRHLLACLRNGVQARAAGREPAHPEAVLHITDPAAALADTEIRDHVEHIAAWARVTNTRIVLHTDRTDAAVFGGSTRLRQLLRPEHAQSR